MQMMSERQQVAFEQFLYAYFKAALWSSTDAEGDPLDKNYSMTDISEELREQSRQDCFKFLFSCPDEGLQEVIDGWPTHLYNRAGHDFWLTRNWHGAGFWDGDWDFTERGGEDLGDRLTDWVKQFPQVDLYVGDNFQIYGG